MRESDFLNIRFGKSKNPFEVVIEDKECLWYNKNKNLILKRENIGQYHTTDYGNY